MTTKVGLRARALQSMLALKMYLDNLSDDLLGWAKVSKIVII